MPDHFQEFPFEEIRKPNGDYFDSWPDAKAAGYDDDQIWSVVEAEGTYTYGPPHHYVNHVGHVATNERHDMETYYHEEPDEDELDEEEGEDDDS
jgi:hypothetical protein